MKADRPAQETPTDLELVCRVNNGDTSAFSLLSDRYMPLLLKRAGRYAGLIGVDVEDFMQEGMFALFRAVKGYKPGASARFSTYALTCIHNSITDAVRAHMKISRRNSHICIEDIDENGLRAFSPVPLQQRPVEDMLLEKEADSQCARQIETLLSEFEQQVLKLYLSGYSYQQISEVLSTATKSVDNALQRVRRKLRQRA